MYLKSIVICCGFLAVSSAVDKVLVAERGDKGRVDNANVQDVTKKVEGCENNKKFENLLARMEHLEAREKSREKTYMREIKGLKRALLIQAQRTASLEDLVRRLSNKCSCNLNQEMDKIAETLNDGNERIKSAKKPTLMQTHRILRTENENPVAFFATLTQHLNHAGEHQSITFDNVVTNIGNAYNSHFGSFTAPVSGAYVFSVTLFSLYHSSFHAQFVKNGQGMTWLYVSGSESGHDTTSQTLILELQKGDDVGVQNVDNDRPIHGFNYSTFAGYLLQEDTSSSVIVGK